MTTHKTCTKCKQDKGLTEFNRKKSAKDGLQPQCKACVKDYRKANREKIAEYQKVYNAAHREEKAEYQKAYHAAHREEIAEYNKAYRAAHREEIAEQQKAYQAANREELNARAAEYRRDRRANDPTVRWIHNTRTNLIHILRGKSSHQPTLDLLGCTGQEWRDHLESKFAKGMNWDNYGHGEGKWQIDHVLPISSFDQSDPEQRKTCWNFRNTQPLWAEDNAAKGNKIPTEQDNAQ